MKFQPDIGEPTTDRLPHFAGLALGHAVDHRIVCEPLELDTRIFSGHPGVEAVVQEDVGDQRGDRTPLRGPLSPGRPWSHRSSASGPATSAPHTAGPISGPSGARGPLACLFHATVRDTASKGTEVPV